MRYLHTMVRVTDVDQSLDFYVNKLGMREVRRHKNDSGRYTLIFLAAPEDERPARTTRRPSSSSPTIGIPEKYGEGGLWPLPFERRQYLRHLRQAAKAGVTINRPRATANMAFVRSPRQHLHRDSPEGRGARSAEPWKSMANTGKR